MPRTRKKVKRKSAKRVARGRRLAKQLPRDAKGKFLPRGSKNLFRKKAKQRKKGTKRRRAAPKKTMARTRRRTGRSLTKDVFPNFMSGTIDVAGALVSNFNSVRVATPIPRLKVTGNRATVMELLWMDVTFRGGFIDGSGNERVFNMSIGATPDGEIGWSNPLVFCQVRLLGQHGGGFTPPVQDITEAPYRYLPLFTGTNVGSRNSGGNYIYAYQVQFPVRRRLRIPPRVGFLQRFDVHFPYSSQQHRQLEAILPFRGHTIG